MDHSLAGQLAGDLTLLMQPKIAKSHLEMLSNKIIETLGLFDGLFSDSEKYFVIAKLLDLVHQIPRLGPTRGLMCLAGERSLSKVKKLVPKGGVEISYRKVETMEISDKTDIDILARLESIQNKFDDAVKRSLKDGE